MSTNYAQNANISPSPLVRGSLVPVEPKVNTRPVKTFIPLPKYLLNTAKKIDSIDSAEELDRLRLVTKLRTR